MHSGEQDGTGEKGPYPGSESSKGRGMKGGDLTGSEQESVWGRGAQQPEKARGGDRMGPALRRLGSSPAWPFTNQVSIFTYLFWDHRLQEGKGSLKLARGSFSTEDRPGAVSA